MLSKYTHTDETSSVEFVARAIRRDKGQLRADVSIRYKGRELDRDEFRFSDRTKRNALSNSAFKALSVETKLPGKDVEMQALTRGFCDLVELAWMDSITIEEVPGLEVPESAPWVVFNYIQEGAGTLLVGPPGVGKSWTGLLMAQSVQYGIPSVYGPMDARPVLYVNLERSQRSLQNRLGLVNSALGLDPQMTMPQLNARGRSMQEVREAVTRHIESKQTELVVVDSLSRMGMGSMSDDDVANAMMDELNSMNVAWLALGHTPRPQGVGKQRQLSEHVFGSQMITAAADFEIILKAKEDPGQTLVGFRVIKANDARKAELFGWKYVFGNDGLERVIPMPSISNEAFEEEK